MKASILAISLLMISVHLSYAQQGNVKPATTATAAEQGVIDLSKQKWQWMSDKNVDKLAAFFHDKSKFVHMSGT